MMNPLFRRGILWAAGGLLAGCLTAAIDVAKVPNPRTTSGLWVEDAGGVLGPEYLALINGLCQTLKDGTSAELAVVTVDDVGGLAVEEFADKLFRRFGIGEKGKDNGLLLLFARDDRRIRFEVGYGLEGVLPDALAGRILDEQALPRFREGQYARGIYQAARAAVEAVGQASGKPLSFASPSVWPAQVALAQPAVREEDRPNAERETKPDPLIGGLVYAAALFGLMVLGLAVVYLRVGKKEAKAAKEKALRGAGLFTGLNWVGGFIGFIILGNVVGKFLPAVLAFVLAPTAATLGQAGFLRPLRRRVAAYELPCPNCGRKMGLLDEKDDDALLTAEEIAEEAAQGMNYEVWKCGNCGQVSRFALKLGKAGSCPKCRRRTLVRTTTTLAAATTSHGGRVRVTEDCKNPACGYAKSVERSTARLSSGSTGGARFGGGSSRSGGSFGGGRSGGGGASKGW